MEYGFGVDLGGTTVKLACFHRSGKCLNKWEIPTVTENKGKQILPDIAAAIKSYAQKNALRPDQLLGIGIGVPGPVDKNGFVNGCVNLGWGIVNIEKELEALTGLPVKAANDANVAALGECWQGGGAGCDNMVMVTLGTGVGGGIIVDGKILPGANGAGGELGHITLNPEEAEVCGCGRRGCAEQYCSATGIVRMAKETLRKTDTTSVLRGIKELTCKDIFEVADTDLVAGTVVECCYGYLGKLIAMVCCVTDPERIVIGGGVSKAGEALRRGIQRHFRAAAFHACRNVEFTLAKLGNDAGVYGAFKLALDALVPEDRKCS